MMRGSSDAKTRFIDPIVAVDEARGVILGHVGLQPNRDRIHVGEPACG